MWKTHAAVCVCNLLDNYQDYSRFILKIVRQPRTNNPSLAVNPNISQVAQFDNAAISCETNKSRE